ncbi:MAG: hypothetical protein BroJett025_08240 [Patescibacteria group bacterium]|nr:MAG: hypothetical protein BroJett025_08240 [Patescibacteria group bacterium]
MTSFADLIFKSFAVLEKFINVSLISSDEIVIKVVFTPFNEFEQFGLVHTATRYREELESLAREM